MSSAPEPTVNTCTSSLPLMVIFAFCPSMTSPEGSVMAGSAELSTIVALLPNEKWIASSYIALPALHLSTGALVSAASIASLKEQLPSVFGSSSLVFTVMMVPVLVAADAVPYASSTATIAATATAANTVDTLK